jgi:hypothetical protein
MRPLFDVFEARRGSITFDSTCRSSHDQAVRKCAQCRQLHDCSFIIHTYPQWHVPAAEKLPRPPHQLRPPNCCRKPAGHITVVNCDGHNTMPAVHAAR